MQHQEMFIFFNLFMRKASGVFSSGLHMIINTLYPKMVNNSEVFAKNNVIASKNNILSISILLNCKGTIFMRITLVIDTGKKIDPLSLKFSGKFFDLNA